MTPRAPPTPSSRPAAACAWPRRAVADCVTACERVVDLGGSVAWTPQPVAAGYYARVADPMGAYFAVIELSEEYAF